MTTFFTDADWVASGEFAESTVSLAVVYDLPHFRLDRFRVPFPVTAGATPYLRLYNSLGVAQVISAGVDPTQLFFDTPADDAWNWATPPSSLDLPADSYRATLVATRYRATSGFFAGGSVTRGDITATGGRFTGGDGVPTSTTTAAYLVDIDGAPIIAPSQGDAALGLDLAVAATGGRASASNSATIIDLAVAATGARTAAGAATLGLDLAVAATGARSAAGAAALGLDLAVAATGGRAAGGAAALGINFAVSATGRNGESGRAVSSFPWPPRPVKSFEEVTT